MTNNFHKYYHHPPYDVIAEQDGCEDCKHRAQHTVREGGGVQSKKKNPARVWPRKSCTVRVFLCVDLRQREHRRFPGDALSSFDSARLTPDATSERLWTRLEGIGLRRLPDASNKPFRFRCHAPLYSSRTTSRPSL